MRIIGLTGGIASGKSLVTEQLAGHGATVIDADKVGHAAYRKGGETFREVVEAFGKEIVGSDGEIDRKVLGGKVFGDPTARRHLERIVWPAMRTMMEEQLETLRSENAGIVVIEAAVLIEADWLPLVDEVWVVSASPATVRIRLFERNGLTEEQADARLRAQLPNNIRRSRADVVIENEGTLEELTAAVDAAWSRLKAKAG